MQIIITEEEIDYNLKLLKDVLAEAMDIEDCARDLECSVEHSTVTEDIGDNFAYITFYVELVIKRLKALKNRADRQSDQNEVNE